MIDSYVLVKNALNSIYLHTLKNKNEVKRSFSCTCLHCTASFPSSLVSFAEEGALCPHCCVVSVLGDASGVELTPSLLKELNEFWFERQVLPADFDYRWFEPEVID